MYYFPRHRLGFFHIPKTGGSSFSGFLIKTLRRAGDTEIEISRNRWHEPIADKRLALGERRFNESRLITTIRNPYATVVSLYFWHLLAWEEQHPDLEEYPSKEWIARMSFSEYIDWYMENEKSFEEYLLLDGILPENLRIAKLERIEQDADRILNDELNLGIEIAIPLRRKSKHGPYMSYLTREDILRINDKYEWVFDRFYADEMIIP